MGNANVTVYYGMFDIEQLQVFLCGVSFPYRLEPLNEYIGTQLERVLRYKCTE